MQCQFNVGHPCHSSLSLPAPLHTLPAGADRRRPCLPSTTYRDLQHEHVWRRGVQGAVPALHVLLLECEYFKMWRTRVFCTSGSPGESPVPLYRQCCGAILWGSCWDVRDLIFSVADCRSRSPVPLLLLLLLQGNASGAWRDLGNVMLCVTGAEALYADMGHFNVLSIRVRPPGCTCVGLASTNCVCLAALGRPRRRRQNKAPGLALFLHQSIMRTVSGDVLAAAFDPTAAAVFLNSRVPQPDVDLPGTDLNDCEQVSRAAERYFHVPACLPEPTCLFMKVI